jgi:hypothetical protein
MQYTDRVSKLLGCSQGVWGAEPPDKLENRAIGTRRATRDECRRHVRKLVYIEWDDPWVWERLRKIGQDWSVLMTLGQDWSEMITLVRSDKYSWV